MDTFIIIMIGVFVYIIIRTGWEFVMGDRGAALFILISTYIIGGLIVIALLSINILGLS